MWTEDVKSYLASETWEASKKARPGDVVMATTSENVEDVCKAVAWLGKEEIAVSGHTTVIHHNQNPKYLAYYFQSELFRQQKIKLAHGTKVIEVTSSDLEGVVIPLPSLRTQERLVRVLDNFDAICQDLEIGLPAEISARKKQYEYYRDQLLNFAQFGAIKSVSQSVSQSVSERRAD